MKEIKFSTPADCTSSSIGNFIHLLREQFLEERFFLAVFLPESYIGELNRMAEQLDKAKVDIIFMRTHKQKHYQWDIVAYDAHTFLPLAHSHSDGA